MAKGTLLSIVLLIVAAELLPEPCEALSFELPLRLPRSPEPKCPGCSHRHSSDCNSNRNSHSYSPKVIVVQEPYMMPPHSLPYHPMPSFHPPMHASYETPSYSHPVQSMSSSYELSSPTSSCEASSAVASYEVHSPVSSYEASAPLSSYESAASSFAPPPPSPQISYNSIKPMSSYSPPPMPYSPPQYSMSYEPQAPTPYSSPLAPTPYSSPSSSYSHSMPAAVPEIEGPAYSSAPVMEQSRYSPMESPGYAHSVSTPVEHSLYSQPQSSYNSPAACPDPASASSYSGYESSYHEEEYRPMYASRGLAAAAEADYKKYQVEHVDHDDVPVYSKYKKRSEPPVKKMAYQPHRDRHAPIMHRNFRPYERERRSENYNEGRDKLYVVYRSEASDDDPSNQDGDVRPADSVIRKAVEIARQQREQENALARHTQQQQLLHRYHYDQSHPDKPYSWQPDFKPVVQPSSLPSLSQQPIIPILQPVPQLIEAASSEEIPDPGMLEIGNVEFDENVGEEAEDPAWRQTEWSTVPSAPYADLEQPGVVYDRSAVPVTISTSIVEESGKLNMEEIAQAKGEIKTESPEEVAVIEDMDMPMTFTEPTSFENPILSAVEVA